MFTFGSLFSGIGGLDLGLERAGMQCIWQVENDEYAQKVLAKHWPDVTRFRDVRNVGKHNLEPVDCIAGGFPCQDISRAGKRAGIKGQKSSLWKEQARIISELLPRYALVENVTDLTKRGLSTVLADLTDIGYDAEWNVVSAASVGALHLRKRLFIIAHSNRVLQQSATHTAGSSQGSEEKPLERLCSSVSIPHSDRNGRQTIYQEHRVLQEEDSSGLYESNLRYSPIFRGSSGRWDVWADEPRLGRVAHGVPCRMDRLRGIGNAVVPQVAELVGSFILEHARESTR